MAQRLTGRRLAQLWLPAGLCVWLAGVPAAHASGNAYADAVLDALAKKGLLTDQEVHDIKLGARQAERQAQEAGANKSGPAKVAGDLLAEASRPAGNTVNSKPGLANFRVWDFLQPRLTYVPADGGREGTNSIAMRRARVGVRGYLADKMPFRYQYDATNEVPGLSNATNLLDAWVSFEHFREQIGDITIGQQFVPGYGRSGQLTASVERKFSEFLLPGFAGRARGITLRRGDTGFTQTTSNGLFDNRLQFGIGLFNGPNLSLNNDNNEVLFAGTLGWRPTRRSPWADEYAVKQRGFNYSLNAGYASSRDTTTLDAGAQAALGNGVELDNEWFSLFGDVEYEHWFGWASWTRFVSDARDGFVFDSDGLVSDSLSSSALTVGGSRTFLIGGNPDIQGWALAFQYQSVDNEHPSRTRFFRKLTGRSAGEVARGMNRGSAYHAC